VKVCPLMFSAKYDERIYDKRACIEEKCAFWVESQKACAIVLIPQVINEIGLEGNL